MTWLFSLALSLFAVILIAPAQQTQGNQLPGIWMCKDKNGETVFSNRTWQYGECKPYVASPGLRESFLEEMILKKKQYAPHVLPHQSSTQSGVFGPL
jgi:hypothetical protein